MIVLLVNVSLMDVVVLVLETEKMPQLVLVQLVIMMITLVPTVQLVIINVTLVKLLLPIVPHVTPTETLTPLQNVYVLMDIMNTQILMNVSLVLFLVKIVPPPMTVLYVLWKLKQLDTMLQFVVVWMDTMKLPHKHAIVFLVQSIVKLVMNFPNV